VASDLNEKNQEHFKENLRTIQGIQVSLATLQFHSCPKDRNEFISGSWNMTLQQIDEISSK